MKQCHLLFWQLAYNTLSECQVFLQTLQNAMNFCLGYKERNKHSQLWLSGNFSSCRAPNPIQG